ncbi:NADPH-dependent F420 reductase [Flavobacterium sp. ZS1P14]|uniref:NADPH-dependent F420 reductase n=1 Tax=Flavobacterium sp. ZS1P14 TaxID=3401729 RepID=UPI003AAE785F
MKIGIIGTGAIGGTIAKKLAQVGHEIKVFSSGKHLLLEKRAAELGVKPAGVDDITKDVDVVILSVPTIAIPQLDEKLFTNISEKVIIVDTSNYYPFRDSEIEELKNGKVESVWVSEQIGRPVIKAFNNLLAESLANGGKETSADDRIAMAISGDDENSKKVVSDLISDVGFDAVDAGTLSESWRHQPGTPAYCTELNVAELKQALIAGIREDAAYLRDLTITKLMERTSPPSHEEIVAFNRSLFPKNPKIA